MECSGKNYVLKLHLPVLSQSVCRCGKKYLSRGGYLSKYIIL
jgi:hypothetical protein